MKTVHGALVVMSFLVLMFCVPGSAVSAGHNDASSLPTLDPGFTTDNDEALLVSEGDSLSDLEQYAYDEGGDDDTYVEEPEDDPDMEPAPEPEDPGPGDADEGNDAPETSDEE